MNGKKIKGDDKMKIGACGIACEVCGLYTSGICEGCDAGTAKSTKERVERLKKLGVLCPILECAMKKGVSYCSRDCKDFPCAKYKEDPFPYSNSYLRMYESRKRQ